MYKRQVVDLTQPFDRNTIYWPTEDGFDLIRGKAGVADKGYYYSANRFQSAEHGGTQVDAPIHFYKDRQTVDTLPIQKLIGEGIVVDVSEACAQDADYQITIEDLRRWETEQPRQLVDLIVLMRTGNGTHWQQRERYLGTAARGPEAVAQLHSPGLGPSAAQWLAEHRAIKASGIDTARIDFGPSRLFESHVNLFKHTIPAFDNVANLDKLPTEKFQVIALPMKIGGGRGGPLRIIAMVPEQS